MNRTSIKCMLFATAIGLSALAAAAPGYQTSSFAILPQNVAKFVSAFDAYMASPAGEQIKGRVILLSHVADGADPATHTLVGLYRSSAEQEAAAMAVTGTAPWQALADAVVPIATLHATTRTTAVRSWGDVVDTDVVWNAHYFEVTDPAGFNAALDAWLASPSAKKFPGQGHLTAISAGGIGAPSHAINVGYASMAEMEAYVDSLRSDPEWLKFMDALGRTSTHIGADVSRQVKAWGPATLKSLTPE